MQHVLVALQYEKASRYSISIFCNFTLWMPPILDALGRRPVLPPAYPVCCKAFY